MGEWNESVKKFSIPCSANKLQPEERIYCRFVLLHTAAQKVGKSIILHLCHVINITSQVN